MRARFGKSAILAAGLLAAQTKPHFEVASVRQSTAPPGPLGRRVFSEGRVTLENYPLASLIRMAWDTKAGVYGLPSWAKTSTFILNAKAASKASPKEMQPMLQSLIEERFRLKFHCETRQMDIYVLSRSGNTKLHPATPQSCLPQGGTPTAPSPGAIGACGQVRLSMSSSGDAQARGGQISTADLARFLGSFWHRTVIDRSEMTGTFDVDLSFSVDMEQPGSPDLSTPASYGSAPPPPPGPPTFRYVPPGLNKSLNEQLGLKLQPAKGPVEVLVIDHVERPTAN